MEWPHLHKAELAEINGIIEAGCIINKIPPKGAKIIDSKWIYDLKTNSINQVIKFKARLSARGDQLSFEDVGNAYSPVASWTGIRYFLALSVMKLGLTPPQLDFELAYLNTDLEERVYMRPPQGFELSDGRVWRLCKSLYGLKQSGKNWNSLLNKLLISLEFQPMEEEPCLYTRIGKSGSITIIFVYIDDVFIASNRESTMSKVIEEFRKNFKLKVRHTTAVIRCSDQMGREL
jgi:hypothetical protein